VSSFGAHFGSQGRDDDGVEIYNVWVGRRDHSSKIKQGCGPAVAANVGAGKEILDALGGGNPEWDDWVADKRGIDIPFCSSCQEGCNAYYPS